MDGRGTDSRFDEQNFSLSFFSLPLCGLCLLCGCRWFIYK